MMKTKSFSKLITKYTTIFILILTTTSSYAQNEDVQYHAIKTHQKVHTGMTVLSTWAVSNLAIGTTQINSSDWYYHRTNMMWNTVNLGLGLLGLYQSRDLKKVGSVKELIKRQKKLETAFIVNSILDIGYITTGAILTNNIDQEIKQTGSSLMLQGGFLLVFDAIMYATIRKERLRTSEKITQLGFSLTGSTPTFHIGFSF
ncbi:MAG: hypothetical protein GY827_12700 [Cytophagales bacterium]|nr:hypothetical protein [Cytophagales bacterium]